MPKAKKDRPKKDWSKPHEVDAATSAFPAHVVGVLMPDYLEIPDKFEDRAFWEKFVRTWFFRGLKDLVLVVRPGIDKDKALRHLGAILGSFEPKHEHKEAAAMYLCSLWFEAKGSSYAPAKEGW